MGRAFPAVRRAARPALLVLGQPGREIARIAAERGGGNRQPRNRLAAIEKEQRTRRMRDLCRALRVEDRAEHVRNVREGDDAMFLCDHPLGRVEIDAGALARGTTVALGAPRRAAGVNLLDCI